MRAAVLVLAAVLSASPLGCKEHPRLSPEEQAETQRLLGEARALGEKLDAERRAALATAKGKVVPRRDLGPCPIEIRVPAGGEYGVSNMIDVLLRNNRLDVVPAAQIATEPGPSKKTLDADLVSVDGTEKASPETLTRVRVHAMPSWWTHDMVIVVDEKIPPKTTGDDSFEGGMLRGRAYVWSYKDKAIVCAGDVVAENSKNIKVMTSPTDPSHIPPGTLSHLDGDLTSQAVIAAQKSLFRAGPPLAP